MKNLLGNISVLFVAVCCIISIVSFAVIVNQLVLQNYQTAWIWMIPFVGSILYGLYSFGICFYLFEVKE